MQEANDHDKDKRGIDRLEQSNKIQKNKMDQYFGGTETANKVQKKGSWFSFFSNSHCDADTPH